MRGLLGLLLTNKILQRRFAVIASNRVLTVLSYLRIAFLFQLIALILQVKSGGDWCYELSTCDPKQWGQVSETCASGKQQSPINLEHSKAKKVAKGVNLILSKDYGKLQPVFLKNNGHSVSCAIAADETSQCLIKGNFLPNGPFLFSSLHFHWGSADFLGSEHLIDGIQYPLELHMIHKQVSDPTKLAVLGILYKVGNKDNPALAAILDNIGSVKDVSSDYAAIAGASINLTKLLPKKVKMFRYQGSLTTPPCSEGVIWTVFDEIHTVSKRQLQLFRSLLTKDQTPMRTNFRPVQTTYTDQRQNIFYMRSLAKVVTTIVFG